MKEPDIIALTELRFQVQFFIRMKSLTSDSQGLRDINQGMVNPVLPRATRTLVILTE